MFSWFPLREEQAIAEGGRPGSAALRVIVVREEVTHHLSFPVSVLSAGDFMGERLCSAGVHCRSGIGRGTHCKGAVKTSQLTGVWHVWGRVAAPQK